MRVANNSAKRSKYLAGIITLALLWLLLGLLSETNYLRNSGVLNGLKENDKVAVQTQSVANGTASKNTSRNGTTHFMSNIVNEPTKTPVPNIVYNPNDPTKGPGVINNTTSTSNATLPPLSFGACCGIGHRITRNIHTLVYARRMNRHAYACWNDIPWNEIFNDTLHVTSGTKQNEHYGNGYPPDWADPQYLRVPAAKSNILQNYGPLRPLFHMPDAFHVVATLHDNVSPRVVHKLAPIRAVYRPTHVCAHFRFGNNETGDWMRKPWRHISDPVLVMNATLQAMLQFAAGRTDVSLFVASDSANARSWFQTHVPRQWHVVVDANATDLPKQGVWFGEHGSPTNKQLSQEAKNDKMAEAVADMFALGECDALFVPTYSSFTVVPIVLMNSRNKTVLFRNDLEFVLDM